MKTLIAGLLLVTSSTALAADKAPMPEPTEHPNWAEVREQGEESLRESLVDPESARFRWTKGFYWTSYKNGATGMFGKTRWGWIACGTLNAKNRMGGYAGPEQVVMLVLPDGTRKSGPALSIQGPCNWDGSRFGDVVAELKAH